MVLGEFRVLNACVKFHIMLHFPDLTVFGCFLYRLKRYYRSFENDYYILGR